MPKEMSIILMSLLYTGKYLPPFFFCPFCIHCLWVSLRLDEFERFKLFLNTTLSRRIQDRAKLFASEQRRNSNLVYMYITRIMANIESLDFKRFLFSLQIVTWESNYKVYKNVGALYIVHPVS